MRRLTPLALIVVALHWAGAQVPVRQSAAQQSAAQQIQAGLQHGAAMERDQHWDDALALYESLYQKFPGHVSVYNRLKELCFRTGRLDRLKLLMAEQERLKPGDPLMAATAGRLALIESGWEDAVSVWDAGLKRHPRDAGLVSRIANIMLRQRRYDEATALYLSRRPFFNKPELFALNLANLYAARFQFGPATAELLTYLKVHPRQYRLIESLLLRYNLTGAYLDQIVAVLEPAAKANPAVKRLLASVWLKAGEADKALAFMDEALSDRAVKDRAQQWFAFAGKALRGGHARVAALAFGRLSRDFPAHREAETMRGLAQSAEAQGDYEKAAAVWADGARRLSASGFGAEARWQQARLVRDHLNRPGEALALLQSLQEKYPRSAQAQRAVLESGRCYLLMNRLEAADSLFAQAIAPSAKGSAPWVRAVVEGAQTAFYRHRFDAALAVLSPLLKIKLDDTALKEPLLNDGLALRRFISTYRRADLPGLMRWASAALAERQHRHEQAVELFDSLSESPLAAEAVWAAATLLAKSEAWQASKTRLETLLNQSTGAVAIDELLWLHGQVSERLHRAPEAVKSYERILVDSPYSLRVEAARQRIRALEER